MAKHKPSFIRAHFAAAAKAMGWETERHLDGKYHVGAVTLEWSAEQGGWNVYEIIGEQGEARALNGYSNRLTTSELVAFLDGVLVGRRA